MIFLIVLVVLVLVSVAALAASKSYDASIRNIVSLSAGSISGLFIGFYVWGYSVDIGLVMYSMSSSIFWAAMIFSPIVIGYMFLVIFGTKNYYAKGRNNE